VTGTFPDAWEEVAIVTIMRCAGTVATDALNFAVLTDEIEINEPDYPGESIPNAAGGRIWNQKPQEDGEVSLTLYPIGVDINRLRATCTITIATPGEVTCNGHGLSVGEAVTFTTTDTLPTGIAAGTIYYVISAGLTANVFRISLTAGGVAINTSGSQNGVHTLYSVTANGLFQQMSGYPAAGYDITQPLATMTAFTAGISKVRDTFLVAIMWTDDSAVCKAIDATSTSSKVATRFSAKLARITSHKASFGPDKPLTIKATFKFPPFDKTGTKRAYKWESTNETSGGTALPALTYTSLTDI
jgi:hypothetical protein